MSASGSSGALALSVEDVGQHNKRDDCWVIVHGAAYDVTGAYIPVSSARRQGLCHTLSLAELEMPFRDLRKIG